jgi:hypothetical protein
MRSRQEYSPARALSTASVQEPGRPQSNLGSTGWRLGGADGENVGGTVKGTGRTVFSSGQAPGWLQSTSEPPGSDGAAVFSSPQDPGWLQSEPGTVGVTVFSLGQAPGWSQSKYEPVSSSGSGFLTWGRVEMNHSVLLVE